MKNYITCYCGLIRNKDLAPDCICSLPKQDFRHLNPNQKHAKKQPFVKGVCRYCFAEAGNNRTVCDSCRSDKAIVMWKGIKERMVR